MNFFRVKVGLAAVIPALVVLGAGSLMAFTNGQDASYELGQPGFSNVVGPTASQSLMARPAGVAYDPAAKLLFVADTADNRVLVFDLSGSNSSGMTASFVLGQTDFNGFFPNTNQIAMSGPAGVAYDPGPPQRLFVADTANNRVLVFDVNATQLASCSPPGGTGCSASYVLGQKNFFSSNHIPDQSGMFNPTSVAYDPGPPQQLFVADLAYSRVLVFDVNATQLASCATGGGGTSCNASYVLGQSDFFSFNQAQGRNGMWYPYGVAYDPAAKWLFVAEYANNRVLVFDFNATPLASCSPPGGTGCSASYVLGQPDFNQWQPGVRSPRTMYAPKGVAYDAAARQLFVADANNSRVLAFDFNATPLASCSPTAGPGCSASYPLGQPDLWNVPWTGGQAGMYSPEGMAYDPASQQLFVADPGNFRVMVFGPPGCGGLAICGKVIAAEDNTINLGGVPLELRDAQGRFLATQKSSATTGAYSFANGVNGSSLTATQNYFVAPLVGRTMSASPLQRAIPNLPALGAAANDFQIRGWPGALKVTGSPPGSLVLVSVGPYAGADPPPMAANPPAGPYFSTAVAGLDGVASFQLPAGTNYYLTCWRSKPSQLTAASDRCPTILLSQPVSPGVEVNQPCPQQCP